MRGEVQRRRGDGLTPFVGAFTGRVVGRLEGSERSL